MNLAELLTSNIFGSKAPPAFVESAEERDRRMAWWREARFGMFIHWGLYSLLGGVWKGRKVRHRPAEWIMNAKMIPDSKYRRLADDFNPAGFDAAEWVRIAKNAGMKYIVATSKHHDGFSMYDSKLTNYNIVKATPFGRDAIAEIAGECRAQGIRFGLYYSQLDWHHSLLPVSMPWISNYSKYEKFMKGQLEELLTRYWPVCSLFFDGDWMPQWTAKRGRELELFCRGLQPDVIINNRVGRRSILSIIPQAQAFTMNTAAGDYETPEQFILKEIPKRDWETCMTFNGSWGYSSFDKNWKSSGDLIRKLVDIAGKGGNFLLNVGPDGEGVIPAPCVKRLGEIGEWMRINGDGIYGTTAGPLQNLPWGRSTKKEDKIFLHVFDWPAGDLVVEGLKEKVAKAFLPADSSETPLPLARSGGSIRIKLPPQAPDPASSTVVLKI